MQNTIVSKLEASRKELLDLGLRNPLLNYKTLKSRGLHIVQEKATAVYKLLVEMGKSMTFLAAPENNNQSTQTSISNPDTILEESYNDTKLQTTETATSLQNKILNTYYAAKTSLEEQGINILYVTLGMLYWYESESSQEERQAPLILIPVALERSSAKERFRLKYTGAEIEENLSLQEKLKTEFGINLPSLPDTDELSIETYFEEIKNTVAAFPRWHIEADTIELGFFSFAKFMIYHDLDYDKWPADNQPTEHPIIKNLLGSGFADTPPTVSEDAFIDTETTADTLYQVVDADSSQLLAMLAVQEGKNLVIQGPPGTGKSQTITNIIANAIGEGKKVLFVAEKLAALEVVKRRLDAISLGEACLELHSHKANKKDLHQELRRILELGKPALYQLQQEVALLESYKHELNDYCTAVNTEIGKSGLTVQKLIGHLLNLYENAGAELPKIPLYQIEEWDVTQMKRAEALAENIQARLQDIGIPENLLFWGSNLKVLLPQEGKALQKSLQEAIAATEELKLETAGITKAMGLPEVKNREESMGLLSMVQLASLKPDLKGLNIQDDSWLLHNEEISELLISGKRLAELHQNYKEIFIPEAWQQDVLAIRQELLAHGDKWFKFMVGAYNNANKQFAALCKTPLPKETAAKLVYIDDLLEAKRLEALLKEKEIWATTLFGKRWQKQKSDWEILINAAGYLKDVYQQIGDTTCPKEILPYLCKNENPETAGKYYQLLLQKINAHGNSIQDVVQQLALNETLRFSGSTLLHQNFTEQYLLLTKWTQRLPEIHQVISWNHLTETASEQNLEGLTNTSINWSGAKGSLKKALQKTWYEYLLQKAIQEQPALRKFEGTSHEQVVEQFKKLDKLNFQYNRARAALTHWEATPRLEAGGQVNILRTEFNKKGRHMPIRRLMQEAGLAIQAIKPVFMMSPLSIANFLPPGALEFDLVIFDEASQVKPVDAIGALLRGKQLIVVGDTKQLPPTSFFDSLTKEIEDEDNITADMPSILSLCDAQGVPQRMLRWHYRSRHESLISLSNQEFYENKLVIFPSPGSRHQLGLVFHHLKDTVYDRGKTRTNTGEADIVAQAVMDHARNHPQLSLGVVAFSTAQMQAIQDVLEIKRKENPDLETFFSNHLHEPFFVKNLENVQGDERDVIFISIGYGRTQEGYISMSFGPLNNDGGEKRLNVLITRAKLRCEVFTNINSDDIDIVRTKSAGIKALKSFLYFAEHGRLGIPQETGREADSPFEENVAGHLTRLGYIVKKQIGSEGFYLDMAIVDAENPGRYIIGIECDGAAYHSARSARDRDRLRQQILESNGWTIHRIWSTDWFRNPERELKRLVAAIERAKERSMLENDMQEALSTHPAIVRENVEEVSSQAIPYQYAQLPKEVAAHEMHLHPVGKLSRWLEDIVNIESPVHFEEVARRIVDAAGVSRVGPRIRDHLKLAAKFAEGSGRIKIKNEFLWSPQMQLPVLRNRSDFAAASRKIKYIAPEEISLAIEKVVANSVAISPEAAVPFVARLFGFTRVTEEMKKEILDVIKMQVAAQKIHQDGELLKA